MKNNYKIITNSTNLHSKKAIFKKLSRSFSYTPRLLRVCFGSEMRLSCASVGFIHRSVVMVHFHRYTKVVFNLLHTFILIILIHVFSTVHNLFGLRFLNKPGDNNCLLTLSINSFHKLNSVKSWVF